MDTHVSVVIWSPRQHLMSADFHIVQRVESLHYSLVLFLYLPLGVQEDVE